MARELEREAFGKKEKQKLQRSSVSHVHLGSSSLGRRASTFALRWRLQIIHSRFHAAAPPPQLGHIQLILPEACLVYVARHPLDTALSCYSQPFGYAGVPWCERMAAARRTLLQPLLAGLLHPYPCVARAHLC